MKNQIEIIPLDEILEEDRISKYINFSWTAGTEEQSYLELIEDIADYGFDLTKPLSVSVNANQDCESSRLHICQKRQYVADDLYDFGGEA